MRPSTSVSPWLGRATNAGVSVSDELEQYLGADAATALRQWCAMTERQVHVPAVAWRGTGYTEAMVAPLFVTELGKGSRLALAKVLPPGQVAEAAAHRR